MIAKIVRQVRQENCLTQSQMAHMMNCTKPYISMIEKGTRKPGRDWIARFSEEFKIDETTLQIACGRATQEMMDVLEVPQAL